MSILMIFRIALKALGQNKMRTALTMLGMIRGVGAVITMVALGAGAQSSIDAQIQSAGTNMIMVTAGNFTQGGVRQGQGNAATLVPEDAAAIADVSGVQYVAAAANTRGQIVAGNQNWNSQVQGTDVDFPLIRSWQTSTGGFFTPQDVDTAAKVAVLGSTVRDQLFGPETNPVGEIIRISTGGGGGPPGGGNNNVQNQPFTAVGVMSVKGQSGGGQDQGDGIFVPYSPVMKKLRRTTGIQQVTVAAVTPAEAQAQADAIATLLRVRHKIQPE